MFPKKPRYSDYLYKEDFMEVEKKIGVSPISRSLEFM